MKTDTPRTDAKLHRANYSNTMPYVCAEFARELERENSKLRENRITAAQLELALVQCYVVPPSAIEDPEGFDGYATKEAIAKAADMLSNAPHQTLPKP
jgi:hypothetical protein